MHFWHFLPLPKKVSTTRLVVSWAALNSKVRISLMVCMLIAPRRMSEPAIRYKLRWMTKNACTGNVRKSQKKNVKKFKFGQFRKRNFANIFSSRFCALSKNFDRAWNVLMKLITKLLKLWNQSTFIIRKKRFSYKTFQPLIYHNNLFINSPTPILANLFFCPQNSLQIF